jgi:hypothetical protein
MPIRKLTILPLLDCRDIEFALPSFVNEQRAVGKNGDGVVFQIFFILISLLIFSTRNNSSDKKLLKFNDESKSVNEWLF